MEYFYTSKTLSIHLSCCLNYGLESLKSGIDGHNHFLWPANYMFLMQPRVWLAFWASSLCFWLMLSFCQPISEFFSIGVLSTYFSPCLYLYLELPQPSCRTLHKALLSILKFTGTHLKPCQGLRGWYVSLNALSLDTRMLCRTASSALQKSKKMMSVFFSYSPTL